MNIPALKHARFRFTLHALEAMQLPEYKGSALRGGFGHSFRKVVCTMGPIACDACLLQAKCVYPQFFETPITGEAPPFMRGVKTGPQPFVLNPPLSARRLYKPGEALVFELVLFGKSIEYLPYFIYTFDRLGFMGLGRGKGKFRLQAVAAWHGEWQQIYDLRSKTLRDFGFATQEGTAASAVPAPEKLSLRFVTPARLKVQGKLQTGLSFRELALNLLRRISTLAWFYMPGASIDWDWTTILRQANDVEMLENKLTWKDWERYSTRQHAHMKLGGLMGEITFAGNMADWLPLLRLGEIVHVGKGATFGLGKFEMIAHEGQH